MSLKGRNRTIHHRLTSLTRATCTCVESNLVPIVTLFPGSTLQFVSHSENMENMPLSFTIQFAKMDKSAILELMSYLCPMALWFLQKVLSTCY